MRRPVPPSTTLAASGTVVAWEGDGAAGVIDLDAGDSQPLDAGDVGAIAVSPSGALLALALDGSISVRRRDDGWSSVDEHTVDDDVFRLAVDDDGSVAAVLAGQGGPATLLLFPADGDGSRHDLGQVTPFELRLDASRRQVLLAGQAGSGSAQGGGEPFVRLGEWDGEGGFDIRWEGPPPVGSPNGWVMPLSFGDIGVHDLDRFVLLSPQTNPDQVGAPVQEWAFGHLETVVAAPGGKRIAWWWHADQGSAAHLRGARLADGSVDELADLDGVERFPAIAVDDDGVVTVVDTVRPATIRVRVVRGARVDESSFDVAGA